MSLNENNFLRWNGAPTKAVYTITPVSTNWNLYANQDYVDVLPLSASSATLGINFESYKVNSIEDSLGNNLILTSYLEYNSDLHSMRVYRPLNPSITDIYIYGQFEDNGGNLQLNLVTHISVSTISTAWIAYSASAVCALDSAGVNNGFLKWTQLILVNQATNTPLVPNEFKINDPADPDYVSPIFDNITCPVPGGGGTYAPLIISNFSLNGANPSVDFIVITRITLACSSCGTGGTPLLLNLDCNIQPGETARFNVQAITWDTGLTITYQVNAGGDMVTAPQQIYWKSQSLGVVDNFPTGGPHPVDNSGAYGNFAITVQPTYGLTIYCQ